LERQPAASLRSARHWTPLHLWTWRRVGNRNYWNLSFLKLNWMPKRP